MKTKISLKLSFGVVFIRVSKVIGELLWFMISVIGSKFLHHFFNQQEVKPKSIVVHTCTFPRGLCQLCVITLSFDWLTGLSPHL